MNEKQHKKYTYFFCSVPLVVFFIVLIIRSYYVDLSDFASYYFGSKLLLTGNYRDAYENFRLNQWIYEQGYSGVFVSYTPFPPFTSIVFSLFTWLPVETAKSVFNILSAGIFTFTLVRSARYFSVSPYVLLLIPILFFFPLRNNIFLGQAYLLVCSLLLEGYMAFDKKQMRLASIWWGIAILLKIFPAVIFLFLLLKKQYKQVVYLIIVCVGLGSISLFINGVSCWKYYLTEAFPRLSNGELNDSFTYMFQSAQLFFKDLFVYDELLNPNAVYHAPLLYVLITTLFKVVITACIIVMIRFVSTYVYFACWLFGSMLISPNGSVYSLILLIIPLFTIDSSKVFITKNTMVMILLLLICNIPVYYLHNFPVLIQYPRLYLLLGLFIFLMYTFRIKLNVNILIACVAFFLLSACLKIISPEPTDNSSYVLKEEKHLLMYDYEIRERKLFCKYWSDKGSTEEQIELADSLSQRENLIVENNQLYYKGIQLTHTPDRKLKPILINEKHLLYLSDKNRGIGMYTLRRLELP